MAQAPAEQQRKLLEVAELEPQLARLDTQNAQHPLREELTALLNAQAERGRQKEAALARQTEAEKALVEAEKPVAALQEQIATKDAQLASGEGLDSRGLLTLQEEIAGLREMLEEAGDTEFEALSAVEELTEKIQRLESDIASCQDTILARKAELEDDVSEIEAEKKQVSTKREELFASLDDTLRTLYNNARQSGGYAVIAMKLNGQTDAGVSLSPVEVDQVRNAPEDEICISEDYDCIIVRI
ncbi:MAG: hypothetical protein IKZ87_00655 [Actinomycetaceae bacterium]|nr:hypothetical protein [Actinomycetaceae bacterium]